jgi:RNA polymerase sigma-70 factor, ECF subfamily
MPSSDNVFERMPDVDVMVRVQWGSERAFEEIYGRYNRRLLNFFYGMGRDPHKAEDLCHETFLRVWQLRVKYNPTGSFPAYLFTVARHIWLEQRRQDRKEWRIDFLLRGAAKAGESPAGLPVDFSAPDEQAMRTELSGRILDALDRLPEEQRMAFVLRTVEGLSLRDISAIMQCPVNTLRSRRLLAIKRLRELLQGLFII